MFCFDFGFDVWDVEYYYLVVFVVYYVVEVDGFF